MYVGASLRRVDIARWVCVAVCVAVVVAGSPLLIRVAVAQQRQQPPATGVPTPYDIIGSTETNVCDGFTMTEVGDVIISRPLTVLHDPEFDAVTKILREGEVRFGNLETNIFDIRTFKGAPQAEYGGAYHLATPDTCPDLKAMGFNLMARANNHSMDWGLEGMRETTACMDRAGIVTAGFGENLAQAGTARFLETTRGRVALVSMATTFERLARAADGAGEAPARPGLNALRLTERIVVTPAMLDNLKAIREALPKGDSDEPPDKPGTLTLHGSKFKVGDKPGYTYEPNERDVQGILRNVQMGKQYSDFCILTNHGHEPGNWSQDPPDYASAFAHQAIDAGADTYIVHGPHQIRGIEIYKGRPIFYSVGNFIMDDLRDPVGEDMYESHKVDPQTQSAADVTVHEMATGFNGEVWYQSIVAVSRFDHNQLSEIRIYPIELNWTKRFADRGVPRLAPPAVAKVVLERLQKLSQPYGTAIAIENNVGVIRLQPSVSSPADRGAPEGNCDRLMK